MPDPTPPRYLSMTAAAARAGIDRATLWHLIQDGRIPGACRQPDWPLSSPPPWLVPDVPETWAAIESRPRRGRPPKKKKEQSPC